MFNYHSRFRYCLVFLVGTAFFLLEACGGGTGSHPGSSKSATDSIRLKDRYASTLTEYSRQQYPDNPNWGYSSKLRGMIDHAKVVFNKKDSTHFDLVITPENDSAGRVRVQNVDLSVFIPTAPFWVKNDPYLTYITLVNQEWNRQQVHFTDIGQQIEVQPPGKEGKIVTRVDIARNCLNAGLWEVILYSKEKGADVPYYHGWFDFPPDLYAGLFTQKNAIPYQKFKKPLEKWVEPENKKIDLGKLRSVHREWKDVAFTSHNNSFYPLVGARKKKFKNIIYPDSPKVIRDFLTDSTQFANFDKPGKYNKNNPRKTQLGKLAHLQQVNIRQTYSPTGDSTYEFVLYFKDRKDPDTTRLVVGGLRLQKIPRLTVQEHNKGFKMPMGISNHSFYENYEAAIASPATQNPYFAMLLNEKGEWLDSHNVGIDGPLMHRDQSDPRMLHLYILSFERHAFVGHFTIQLPAELPPA